MRILIVFHGWFPAPGRPVAGGALRAWHHAEALRAAGHEVHLVTRSQDCSPAGPPGFSSGPALQRHAERIQPQAILCVQPEEAPWLAGLDVPLVVDLYAPRLLEAQFQDSAGQEAVRSLRAVQAGDFFLFSNPRQRDFYLGLLALAGVDLRQQDFGAVVPLAAPHGPPRRARRPPRFVMGGVAWPWLDPLDSLRRAVTHLERRGEGQVLVYGNQPIVGDTPVADLQDQLPAGPRLVYGGVLPYDELLASYAQCAAALDMMAPSPERSLAVAFRQMDYLGCGLPMIVGEDHALAELLRKAGAGIVGLEVEQAIDLVLDDPRAQGRRARAARNLARERFDRERCEAPLLRWLQEPRRRRRSETLLGSLAELSARESAAQQARQAADAQRERMVAEVAAKRQEVAALNERLGSLTRTAERLSGAVAEVAGFKREAIAVLGAAEEQGREELRVLGRELSEAQAHGEKKSAEIEALGREKEALRVQLAEVERRLEAGVAETDRLNVKCEELARDLAALQADGAKKSAELKALAVEEGRARQESRDLAQQLSVAQADIAKKSAELEGAILAAEEARSELRSQSQALSDARADIAKKSAELQAMEDEQRRLENDLLHARRELERLKKRRFLG